MEDKSNSVPLLCPQCGAELEVEEKYQYGRWGYECVGICKNCKEEIGSDLHERYIDKLMDKEFNC